MRNDKCIVFCSLFDIQNLFDMCHVGVIIIIAVM